MTNTPNIIWQPQKGPQTDFIATPVFEALIGGAAGGGKSEGLLGDSLRQVHKPRYRAIIFRRKTKNLQHLIDRSQEIIPKAFPGADWKDSIKTWAFPSGAKLLLWHMEEEKHKFDHDGLQYQFIGFDELTHFTETQYLYMHSRCRSSDPDIDCYVRASGMPQGRGVAWVKVRFIDNGPYNVFKDPETGLERVFIPARLEDNPALMKNDPLYEQRLKLMGPKLYRALRHGDWTVVEGAAFEELDPQVHKVNPHEPPMGVPVWRSLDWGYAKPFSVGWYYTNSDKQTVRFKEWYGCSGPDKGIRMGPREVAKGIKEIDKRFTVVDGIADPSIWSKIDDGPSIAEAMEQEGVIWRAANNDRIQGKMEIHRRLSMVETGEPQLLVTSDCKHWWRTFPMLQCDPRRPEDVDTKMEDHIYDETRYALMDKPMSIGADDVSFGEERATANQSW